MGRINVLDKHVAELIAAGEVVERPSSVIKELVENSIDAGATAITVEIKNGGTTFMRVADNGCGIMREDIKVAFLRHATSKVKLENDLDSISTLGFRGEALASISAVSHLELITKSDVEEIGTRYVISGGEEVSLSDAGCPNGTTFIIRDLFYNIPARMKFLKTDVGEGNAVSNVIDKIALSHPNVAITYIKDSKQVLKTSGDGKLLSAIYSVYGRDFASTLIPVDYDLNGITVKGYVSKPQYARPNRNMQNFFINGRFVKSGTAMAAVAEACKGSVMVGKFASCVLNINIDFEAVDVNVHPAKIEVRFVNERPVFDAIYHAIKSALNIGDTRKNAVLGSHNTVQKKVNPFELAQKAFRERDEHKKAQSIVIEKLDKKVDSNPFKLLDEPIVTKPAKPISFSQKVADSSNTLDIYSKSAVKHEVKVEKFVEEQKIEVSTPFETTLKKEITVADVTEKKIETDIKPLIDVSEDSYRYIGEAFKTYIIIEKNSKELILIDKHAAHERIIYEKLKEEKGSGYSQLLLEPISVTLNKIDYNSVINNIDLFNESGFDVEDFGDGVVLVRSAPQYLEKEDIEQTIVEMSGYLTENKKSIKTEQMDWIFHNVSCRSAIKAGNISTDLELIDLAKKVESDSSLRYCPHGRPLCIVIKKHEIEKQFGRV
ncbi:MAG: DNA mismatch repair endonuclease MutL [Ruminococcaceae bacterium]|nr:DNA mismatch repair endonuclease MutL [Oscillospiraceae bacterium]